MIKGFFKYAETEFELGAPVAGGATVSAHLIQRAKTLGKDPEEFVNEQRGEVTECPLEFRFLWDVHEDLSDRRRYGFYGIQRITFQEVEAWSRLHNVVLQHWEIWVLGILDRLEVRVWRENKKKEQPK